MTSRFCRYELRTTDADAARAFYAGLLGHDRAIIWPLHEQARARGAMPHWLGSIAVDDVPELERISAELVSRGAMMLGPIRPSAHGGQAAVLRDPGGAIVGLTTRPAEEVASDVSWHVLNTNNLANAIANYATLFGWSIAADASTGPHGAFHEFRWDGAQRASAGAMADIAGRPEVHPHWLFFLDVASAGAAVAWTRGQGGTAMDPIQGPAGESIAICEDPQGAAFGVIERTGKLHPFP